MNRSLRPGSATMEGGTMGRPDARTTRSLMTSASHHFRRKPARFLFGVLVASLLAPLVPLPSLPGQVAPADAFPGSHVTFEGKGWGHGRGMGQWGALGYAVDHNWSYSKILDHFYGNTSKGSIGNPTITVRLTKFDSSDALAFDSGGLSVTGVGGSPKAVRVQDAGGGKFRVQTSSGCAGPWSTKTTVSGNVDISGGSSVAVCESGGLRTYRGSLRVTRDSEGPQRLVNVVAMDHYLKGVVPRESPASWGDSGGGRGMEALKAQAVAARSYAHAENRYSYAKTCDTTACQVYSGYAFAGTVLEYANTNTAIAATSGEVRKNGSGTARTEFSASTGGYTTGPAFPNVRDDGDNTSGNPHHNWSQTVAVNTIQARYPSIGTLLSITVTKRNGKGAMGGRVLEVVLLGTRGTATVSGGSLRSTLGLKSDWFQVVNNPSGGLAGYYVADSAGGVFTFGNAKFHGSIPGLRQKGQQIGQANVVGMAVTRSGNGYYAFDDAGGAFTFGDAKFYGSIPGLRQKGQQIGQATVVDMLVTPSGNGYYASDDQGGVFTFGDARFYGSIPGLRLKGQNIGRATVVDMELTPSGKGYWQVDDVGGVFTFGDAAFRGSIPYLRQRGQQIGRADVVDMAATKSGKGYWQLDDAGGVFSFGDAPFYGSLPGMGIRETAVSIEPSATGRGYLILTRSGNVYSFGDAPAFGNVRDAHGGFPPIATDLAVIPEA